jgi:hypothetical protein
MMPPGA